MFGCVRRRPAPKRACRFGVSVALVPRPPARKPPQAVPRPRVLRAPRAGATKAAGRSVGRGLCRRGVRGRSLRCARLSGSRSCAADQTPGRLAGTRCARSTDRSAPGSRSQVTGAKAPAAADDRGRGVCDGGLPTALTGAVLALAALPLTTRAMEGCANGASTWISSISAR